MRKHIFLIVLGLLAVVVGSAVAADTKTAAAPAPAWSLNATIIEACSCPMF